MEKRIPYYVSRKNIFTWLAVLTVLAGTAIRVVILKDQPVDSIWLGLVPVLAGIIYALILLLDGNEHLYRAFIPALLFAIYFCVKTATSGYSYKWVFLACVAYIAIAIFFGMTVNGTVRSTVPLFFILLGGALAIVISKLNVFKTTDVSRWMPYLPDIFFLLAGVFMILAINIHLDGRYHPTWGDRADGRKLRNLDPITVVGNYIMPTRNGAANHISDSIEISEIEKYIAKKRKEGYKGFGITHIFIATYVRCVAKYPGLNRFLSGQQLFSRDDDIQFCMTVKSEMSLDGEESIAKLHFKPTDTIDDVYNKLKNEIDRIKSQPVGDSSFDKTAKLFSYIPGLIFKFVMWIIKILDYLGFLPKFLLEISPFHASIFFTSMASLGIPPVIHHLYDFGNVPVFCALGAKRTVNEISDDGIVKRKKYIDYTFNTDDRIIDGFYYAEILRHFKKILANPEILETPPEEVIRDID